MRLHHRSGAAADLPSHVVINRQFELVDNWSDFQAYVILTPSKYTLHSLLPDDVLPNSVQFKTSRPAELNHKAADIARSYWEEVAQSRVGDLSDKPSVVASARAARRQDTLAKARVARTQASAQRRKARRVEL